MDSRVDDGDGGVRCNAGARADERSSEEIVVTARKRDETAQNVPITMDVFTTQEIQSAGIDSPRDFVAMVPNMTFVETQNVGNSFITIRGISQARNSEPSVAVLVDGVLETNPYEFNQELYDIQADRSSERPAGRLVWTRCDRRRDHHQHRGPVRSFRGYAPGVGVGNGLSEKAQVALERPARFRRDAALPRFVEFLQYRRLSEERLSRPQCRPVSRLLGPAATGVEARGRVQRGPAFHVRLDRYHRLLLRHSAQRRGEPVQRFHDAREMPTTRRRRSRTTIWARTIATSWIPRSSSTTTRDMERSPRSRTSITPERSTPEMPTISGP